MPFSLNSVTPGIAMELIECEACLPPQSVFLAGFLQTLSSESRGYPPTAGELCKGLLLSRGVPTQFWERV